MKKVYTSIINKKVFQNVRELIFFEKFFLGFEVRFSCIWYDKFYSQYFLSSKNNSLGVGLSFLIKFTNQLGVKSR